MLIATRSSLLQKTTEYAEGTADGRWWACFARARSGHRRSLHHEVAKASKEQPMGDDRWRIADLEWIAEERRQENGIADDPCPTLGLSAFQHFRISILLPQRGYISQPTITPWVPSRKKNPKLVPGGAPTKRPHRQGPTHCPAKAVLSAFQHSRIPILLPQRGYVSQPRVTPWVPRPQKNPTLPPRGANHQAPPAEAWKSHRFSPRAKPVLPRRSLAKTGRSSSLAS